MVTLSELPKDVLIYISEYLEIHDMISLSATCKNINNILFEKLYELYHKCGEEIEDKWNWLSSDAERAACYNSLGQVEKTRTEQFECTIQQNVSHFIEVAYVHNPRDVDIVAWYLEGKKIGWRML